MKNTYQIIIQMELWTLDEEIDEENPTKAYEWCLDNFDIAEEDVNSLEIHKII